MKRHLKEKAVILYANAKNQNIVDGLVNYCSDNKLEVIETFMLMSSSRNGRKKYVSSMLKFIKEQKGRINIVCDSFSSIIQDSDDWTILKTFINRNKIAIHLPKEHLVINRKSLDSEMYRWINFMIYLREFYIDSLSHNIKAAKNHFISKGYIMGPVPIGYINTKDKFDKADAIIDTEKANVIIKLFIAYSTGLYSIKTLTEFAHDLGLKNKKGRLVSKTCVNDILKNPFYIGMQRWNGQLYPHKYPTLIHKTTFDRVQKVLAERSPNIY